MSTSLSRTQLEICVQYTQPAHRCRRVLRVLPLHRQGQTILSERWKTNPEADLFFEKSDQWGNRRLFLSHKQIETEFRFGLELQVETNGAPVAEAKPDFARWKMPSRAVAFTPELQKIARDSRDAPPLERAAHLAHFCAAQLQYRSQTSPTPPTASQIWTLRRGNCADFAHVLLSLCRSSGLPARYVAGFNPTQGQMHAWVEVWANGFWHAFDPTLGRAASVGSVAVCIGRDFYDCAPHTGSFRGAGFAGLSLWSRTEVSPSKI
jgi:transglutaminase-like putative cysteine protease